MAQFWAVADIPDEALANIETADRWGRDYEKWLKWFKDWQSGQPLITRRWRRHHTPEEYEAETSKHRTRHALTERVFNRVGFVSRSDMRSVARIGAFYFQAKSHCASTLADARDVYFLLPDGEPVSTGDYVDRHYLEEIEPAFFNRVIYHAPY
jgi:hypothetical protein